MQKLPRKDIEDLANEVERGLSTVLSKEAPDDVSGRIAGSVKEETFTIISEDLSSA